MGNYLADGLSKMTLRRDDDELVITEVKLNNDLGWEYMLFWRGLLTKECPRTFMKKVNQLQYEAEWLALEINRSYRNYRININNVEVD